MGIATYYMMADGCTKEKLDKIKAFFSEGFKAELWWQNHRDYEREEKCNQFWTEFDHKFKTVSKYLKFIGKHDGDCNNDLAGYLDFGNEYDIEEHFECVGETLRYYAECWHFADWDPLMMFLEDEFELTNARWLSDEYINPFDLL